MDSDRSLNGGSAVTPTRRDLLKTSSLAVTVGVAGCLGGSPRPSAMAGVRVRESFEREGPSSADQLPVPIDVTLSIRTVDTTDSALRGVEVVALDHERRPLATRTLGEFAYADAAPEQRRTSTYDEGIFDSTTVYRAEWNVAETIETPAVPAWLTFSVDEVRFGDEADAPPAGQVVGRASARPPPPHLDVSPAHLRATPPLPPTVGPDHYQTEQVIVQREDVGDDPYLPAESRLSPTRSPTPTTR